MHDESLPAMPFPPPSSTLLEQAAADAPSGQLRSWMHALPKTIQHYLSRWQADLLKLYIYGYLNRVRSSRRLEAETRRNLEVMWLLRGLTPDLKTIADFRKDNRDAFKPVFREFVLLCRKLDLFGRELLAVDGTPGTRQLIPRTCRHRIPTQSKIL